MIPIFIYSRTQAKMAYRNKKTILDSKIKELQKPFVGIGIYNHTGSPYISGRFTNLKDQKSVQIYMEDPVGLHF